MIRATATLAMALMSTFGCRREAQKEQGEAPPPTASVIAGLCSGGGGKVADAVAAKMLPTEVGGYCIDPHNEVRTYGKDAKGTIEQVCTELFDGECEVYRTYGLERVISIRYADGSGTPGTVTVNISRFESNQNAFGFFTRRILGDSDPSTLTAEPFEAGTMAASGAGVAYVVRGPHVAELSYANDNEAPDALRASSKRILPTLAKAIGELLPGERELPAAARLLPEPGRIKLGVQFEPKDVLGVTGSGSGAIGHYRDGDRRYRLVVLERPNEQAAQDVMKTFRRIDGATEQKGPPATITFGQRGAGEGVKIEWVIGRVGNHIVGLGDDEFGSSEPAKKAARFSSAEKQGKVAALLNDLGKRAAGPTGPQ